MSEEMNLYKRCKNIFKFHGVDMGGGGESAPEVENAIETHGLGWTDTEEKAGFDIQWDGNTEGLESFGGLVYKMPDGVYVPDVIDDLIGASVTAITGDDSNTYTIDESYIDSLNDDIHFVQLPNDGTGDKVNLVLVVLNESYMSGTPFARGIWLVKTDAMYVSRVCKESTTEEVVHQIDQKYIPGGSAGGGMVVNFTPTLVDGVLTLLTDKTPAEVKSAMLSGTVVGTIQLIGETEINPLGCAAITPDSLVGFGMYGLDAQTLTMKYMITCDESFTEWILHQG